MTAGKGPQHPPERATERATERVAVLMTPTEKAAYTDRAHNLGLSLGQFFREAGAVYAHRNTRAERTLDAALAEVRAALSAQPWRG